LPKTTGTQVVDADETLRELTPEELERQRSAKVFDQVSEHLKREPNQSSRLLQSWIHSE
jgi:flagellar M-ring protein FliF